jgi:hypothetical protein
LLVILNFIFGRRVIEGYGELVLLVIELDDMALLLQKAADLVNKVLGVLQ